MKYFGRKIQIRPTRKGGRVLATKRKFRMPRWILSGARASARVRPCFAISHCPLRSPLPGVTPWHSFHRSKVFHKIPSRSKLMKAEGKRLLNMECMVPSGPRYERGITLSNEERAAAMEDCLLQTERQADELIDGETEQVWGNQARQHRSSSCMRTRHSLRRRVTSSQQ